MPQDCPHNRCSYFLASPTSRCPACGRRVDPYARSWVAALLGAFVVLALILLPVRSTLGAGIAIIAVAVAAMAIAFRPRSQAAPITTLEDRYQQALTDTQYWLENWNELFALQAEVSPDTSEQLLLDEALAAAAEAAAEAVDRRNRYGGRFIVNGFERLDRIAIAQHTVPSPEARAEIARAVATIEHYLETLWIDERVAEQAQLRLAQATAPLKDVRVLEIAGAITLFGGSPRAIITGDVDSHRFRLQAERRLLEESPRSDPSVFDELL